MIKFLRFIFRIISIFYPYWLHQKLVFVKDACYSMWIRNFLGKVGERSTICYPCQLQGGGQKNIYIGNNTTIQASSILGCWTQYGQQQFPNASIKIGDNCSIGEFNHITSCDKIIIGNGVLTGRYVLISDNNHGGLSAEELDINPINRELKSNGGIVIGDNVWLGDKVSVLTGVHIGKNTIVAANAVVTTDLPDNCMAAGVPAKIVKKLS